jgi:hypothetical protein
VRLDRSENSALGTPHVEVEVVFQESSMSEHATVTPAAHDAAHLDKPTTNVPLEQLFDREDVAQFDRDDVQAGSAIGKMLALFFLYTVIVMALAAYWTYTVSQ